jgi:DNA-directed RNA polymerase specialized sigma24 family protein
MAAAFEQLAEEESGGDEQAALAECLAALPESSALLIRGRYFSRRNIDDLAAASGQTAAAVYQSLCRLRRRLADCIRHRLKQESLTPLPHA